MAEHRIQFQLMTPVRTLFDQAVDRVIVPTQMGQITVLPEHTYLVSILQPGELIVQDGAKEFPLAVAGGVLEVYNNKLVVLADTAEHVTDIDTTTAEEEARKLAAQLKEEKKLDVATYTALERLLAYQEVRMELSKKWRRK